MEAAAAMDFHALSRRELQALCKRNGVRANMTNAAMAEALQGLSSVDGVDEIGTTLCLPTPGRSAMKSAAKMAREEQQHGSPLPRGRRVSVKSPEAIRMEVEEGEDEMKRDLVKEIVKTPGVALRSTSRRARATPAPLPTPVPASSARATARRAAARKTEEVVPTPATLRRSHRTAARKGAGPVEVDQLAEDLSAAKRTTRSARSKATIALEEEDEVGAIASKEEKVLQEGANDEEEVTKLLEGDNKEEELEKGEEVDSSDATIGSAMVSDKSEDPKEEEVAVVMEEQSTKPREADSSSATVRSAMVSDKGSDDSNLHGVAAVMEEQPTKHYEGIMEEQEPISVEKSATLTVMDDSPILGVVETPVPEIEKEQDASVEDDEGLAEWSPLREMNDQSILVLEDKEVVVNEEAIKEDGFAGTGDTDPTPEEILSAAVEDKANEDDDLTEVKEGVADEMLQAEPADNQTSEENEEDGHTELKEGAAHEVPQAERADDETSADAAIIKLKEGSAVTRPQAEPTKEETRREDDLDEDKEWASDDEEASDEIGSSDVSDEETDESSDESYSGGVVQKFQGTVLAEDDLDEDKEWASDDDEASDEIGSSDVSDEETETSDESYSCGVVQRHQGPVLAEEDSEDASTEDDDFSGDLPPEFDNIAIYSDAETESDIAPPVLEENKAAVTYLDDSSTNVQQQMEVLEESDATEKATREVDNIVMSLDELTFKEEKAKEMTKQRQVKDYTEMSIRKLKTEVKNRLIALKEAKEEVTEGKRLPLEEVDANARVDG